MEKKIKTFEDLEIWKRAAALAIQIYEISESGKLKIDFGAKDQIRRAACSISNNIAEGFEYNNNRQFVKFLRFAKGSAGELRNQVYILFKVGYLEEEKYLTFRNELLDLSKQISNFMKYLTTYEKEKSPGNN